MVKLCVLFSVLNVGGFSSNVLGFNAGVLGPLAMEELVVSEVGVRTIQHLAFHLIDFIFHPMPSFQ